MTVTVGRQLCALVLAALFLWTLPAALAQTTLSDSKLEAFAEAAIKVDRLISAWNPRLQEAKGEAQAALAEQANLEMRKAIQGTEGISIEEYQAISSALRDDAELHARIEAIYTRRVSQ